MEFSVGVLLAGAVGVFATLVGFDRGRTFYAVVLIVIASYYALFAVIGGSAPVLWTELLISFVFVAFAVAGFLWNPWLIVLALAGHGVLDAVHPHLLANRGVPHWWPHFCLAFDMVAGAYLAARLWLTHGSMGGAGR